MTTATEKTPMKAKDYKSDVPPTWCAGCGDYGVLNSTLKAFAELKLEVNKMSLVSGIGCSSRFPYFVKTYGMHTAHGRALPAAAGLKVARPDQEVIAFGGDGDGFSIGGGHVPHIARKNTDITYICMNNSIYGLTKGQMSPTSQVGMVTSTTPYGVPDAPMSPAMFCLAYGATYVARAYSSEGKKLQQLIKEGIEHKGFAFIDVVSPCPTYNKVNTFESYKGNIDAVPDDHDVTDQAAAMKLVTDSEESGRLITGLYFKVDRPTLVDRLDDIREKAGADDNYDLQKIMDIYKP